MALTKFKCTDFRCLESVEVSFSRRNNLIAGPNASGKTSILEAVAYLGRARSFRGASTREITRHGREEFLITGTVDTGSRELTLGIRNGREGQEVRAGGEKSGSAVPLAEALPLQLIDPDVHALVAGGPEGRRRYLDWIAFHVEQGYLEEWRRFRRALKQRNAALKTGANRETLLSWNRELAGLGSAVDSARARMVDIVGPGLESFGHSLLGSQVDVSYSRGWASDKSLAEALDESLDRDRQLGSTQAGPQRADLRLHYDERQARKRVSRGQQKLLACAMILAAAEVAQRHLQRPLLLLLDDPAAELDSDSVQRLMVAVEGLQAQVIATTLDSGEPLFRETPAMFHVEQGRVRAAS